MNYYAVSLLSAPTDADWLSVKARALVTIGRKAVNPPSSEWKHAILEARHSPIRCLRHSFYAEEATPELHGLLVPLCEYCGGVCHEMEPCGRYKRE